MNKHEFWTASLARGKELEKQYWWIMAALFTSIIVPGATFYLVADEISSANRQFFGNLALGTTVASLFGLMWLSRRLANRSTKKFNLSCPNCGVAFEGELLTALGFTDTCSKCGASVFAGSNSTIERDARKSGARPSL
jgi:ribosomal protein S27AE